MDDQSKARDPLKLLASRMNLRAECGVNSNVRAVKNQEKVLLALSRFGWLPVKQVAKFCWPDDKTPRCAERTLAALRKRREVTFKELTDRTRIYTLTAVGVARVSDELGKHANVDAEFAKRSEPQFEHRFLSNMVCVWWKRESGQPGAGYFTEHEIVQSRAPLRKYEGNGFEKIPDALLVMDGQETSRKTLVWVEVERGHKKDSDQKTLVMALCYVLSHKNQGLQVDRYEVGAAIVVCPTEELKHRFCKFLFDYLKAYKYRHDLKTVLARLYIFDPASRSPVQVWQWALDHPEWSAAMAGLGFNFAD